jgi:hypothetical protein
MDYTFVFSEPCFGDKALVLNTLYFIIFFKLNFLIILIFLFMKKSFFILLVPLLFLMAHCKKDDTFLGDHTIAEGIIKEDGTGKAVANVQVRLRKCTYQLLGSSSCMTIDTIRTDANGFYHFDFKHDKAFDYELRVSPDDEKYLVIHNDAPLENGRYNKNINLIITPYAWIKLRIRKKPPFFFDSLALYGGPHGNPDWYVGEQIDSLLKFEVIGNTKQLLGWTVYRMGSKTTSETYLYCPGHDTTNFEISY